jgi:hypothetical protein
VPPPSEAPASLKAAAAKSPQASAR